ncbi:MAG TPA: pitrilysin family protein [Kofleriaceae bacterium]|nr:pitrilysin family protein [Kofleriaceae bacterium]
MILSIATAMAVAIAPSRVLAQQPAPPAPPAPPAARPAPQPPRAASKLPAVEQAVLANGLQIAVLRNDTAPVVSVQLWYRAGSKDEPRDRRGTAQMFKHLMYRGTKHARTDAHALFVTGVGGFAQAIVDEDASHYVNTLPADYLDFAIRLEAERMRNLLLRPDVIAREREAVKDEIRQQEGAPLSAGFLRFIEAAYTKHPYAWTADGKQKDVDAITAEDLQKFYDAYYQPNNALLVVVGKTTLDAVKASAEQHFGAIPKAPEPPRPSRAAAEPPQTAQRRHVLPPGPIGLTFVGFHIPAAKDRDIYALQVASIILGVGETSRLKVRLRSNDPKSNPKRPYALDGGVEAVVREEPGVLITLGIYREAAQGEGVEAAILDELGKLAGAGPTADELRKAKNQIQSGFVFSLENSQGLAQAIGRSWTLVGDPGAFMRDVDEIEKLTPADVARAVKQHLAADKATIVVIPPKGGK